MNQQIAGYAQKVNQYSEGSELDKFARGEADALKLPYEFVRDCVYTQPKGGKHLYYGQGHVAILAVIAETNGLGILEFEQPKFRMLDLKLLLSSQESLKKLLFVEKDATDNVQHYHRLGISSIEPDPDAIEDLKNYGKSFVFFNKKRPAIHSCILNYRVHKGSLFVGKSEGSVEYVVDYNLTNVCPADPSKQAPSAYHIIPTMITRAKKLAYEKAFGMSPTFFMKACKMDFYSESRADNIIINDVNDTEDPNEHHRKKLANVDDAMEWQSPPTVI